MLVHPWDAVPEERWRTVLAENNFGQLVTSGHVEGYPVVVPTHFTYDGDRTVVLHLARPNPVWQALDVDPRIVIAVVADHAYVEAAWNADLDLTATERAQTGVPTSYYTSVQVRGRATVVDDPDEKAAILDRQLAHLEPPGSTRLPPSTGAGQDRRLLPGIRGIRVEVDGVLAKMKYGGNKSAAHRTAVAEHLEARGAALDAAAARRVRESVDGTLAPRAGAMRQA